MISCHAQHDSLFRSVAEILVRDYIAPSETADTVAEWCEKQASCKVPAIYEFSITWLTCLEPSELAALISDVEGYEKR